MASLLNVTAHMPYRFIDIGVNVLDDMYQGRYHGKESHDPDIDAVFERSFAQGLKSLILTSTTVEECSANLKLCRSYDGPISLVCTTGIHPTRCSAFQHEPNEVISQLESLLENGISDRKVVSYGEFGLDYDRLHFCSKELQIVGFQSQLKLAAKYRLPMFLHNRNTEGDFVHILAENRDILEGIGGVVHSFDGSEHELKAILDLQLGLYIGINGCSLKTAMNLEVAAKIPLPLLLIETDAPWCGIKPSHAGFKFINTKFATAPKGKYIISMMVKDRNEPCTIVQVLEILSAIRNQNPEELAGQIYDNTVRLFRLVL
jgi:TatD DNase family protein